MSIAIGIAEDHKLVSEGIISLMAATRLYEVVLDATDGEDLMDKLKGTRILPKLLLIDIHMPRMNGLEAMHMVRRYYPGIHYLALSNDNQATTIQQAIDAGAKGFVLKDRAFEHLVRTVGGILKYGHYFDDEVNVILATPKDNVPSVPPRLNKEPVPNAITPREMEFILLCCSDLPYKQIADQMKVRTKTIESFRDHVCQKLNVHGRAGIMMYAIKNGLYKQ